jgi:hypothetical protein
MSKRVHQIKVKTQVVGVEADAIADNSELVRAQKKLADSRLCFYPKGTPHSLLNPAAEHPQLSATWMPALREDSLAFITEGTWFPEQGTSPDSKQALCRTSL